MFLFSLQCLVARLEYVFLGNTAVQFTGVLRFVLNGMSKSRTFGNLMGYIFPNAIPNEHAQGLR